MPFISFLRKAVDEVRASLFDVNRTVSRLVAVGKNLQTQLEGVNQELQSLRQTCTAKGFPISKFCSDYLPGPIKLDANFSQVRAHRREKKRLAILSSRCRTLAES